jgi:hypothetical protein
VGAAAYGFRATGGGPLLGIIARLLGWCQQGGGERGSGFGLKQEKTAHRGVLPGCVEADGGLPAAVHVIRHQIEGVYVGGELEQVQPCMPVAATRAFL